MSAPSGTVAPTQEQRAVIEQPADAHVLVTAGPGSGKTHTLIRRIDFLVTEKGLSPAEIQVLTFSRAAVRELRTRLGEDGGPARGVRAQTFDAWALALLNRIDADTAWEERPFEERIEGASRAIEESAAGDDLGTGLRHLVVDEVQDLVGPRRELVEALIDACAPGFTLVGDPAQSIYGFTVTERASRAQETGRFFTWVKRTFAGDLVELALTRNFRAAPGEARVALPHGPALQRIAVSGGTDDEDLHEELRRALRGTLNLGLDSYGCDVLRDYNGSSAILSQYNHLALEISETLWKSGVDHEFQRSAQDRSAAPPWLVTLFHEVDGTLLRRERFTDLLGAGAHGTVEGLDRLWNELRRTTGDRRSSNTIDLPRLRRALAQGALADELMVRPRSNLVVSSFHRAKGLEFDRVVVLDPGRLKAGGGSTNAKRRGRQQDPAEEARLLYVAMTRARQELLHLPSFTVDVRGVRRVTRAGHRWGRFSGQHPWKRLGLEVTGKDVDTRHPGGTSPLSHDPVSVQKHLAEHVRPGDPVTLERIHPTTDREDQSPPYAVVHQDQEIGISSEKFRSDLYRYMQMGGDSARQWPRTLRNIRVDSIESVAGSEASGARSGLGPHGVWLAPRLTGLSRFEYDNTSEGGPR